MGGWLTIGALGAAISIALGAFGAHGLRARLDAEALALWETGARYLMYACLGLMAFGMFERQQPGTIGASALLLSVGALIFSGTLAGLALGGPRWLGAVTPIGGASMIAGFVWFAWIAAKNG